MARSRDYSSSDDRSLVAKRFAYKDELSQRSIILDKIGVEKGLPFLGPPPARPKPPSYDDVASSL